MRLPTTAHTARPWRVHEFAEDFELEDVWALPTPGGPDDLPRLVQLIASPGDDPFLVRALFVLRWKLGALFGWDKPGSGVGERVPSLRERLPVDLLEAPRGPDLRAVPGREEADGPPIFSSVYQTHDEWLAEFANKTVHSLMHIGWVPDGSGSGYHAQMAVLVKPNGRLGKAYMAAIKPFRYALVYPLLLRSLGREWQSSLRHRVARRLTATHTQKGEKVMSDNQTPPQPDPALRRLDRLVGRWSMEGNLVGSDEKNIKGETSFRWLPGGFFLEQRAHIDFGGLQVEALELIGYDPETDTFPSAVYSNFSPEPLPYKWDVQGESVTITVSYGLLDATFTGSWREGGTFSGGWRPNPGADETVNVPYDIGGHRLD